MSTASLRVLRTGSWGLRDYGTGSWDGGDPDCDHTGVARRCDTPGRNDKQSTQKGSSSDRVSNVCLRCGARRVDQQLGLEPTPELYVARLVEVFREVRRVLRADGTCWLNLGDSYASSPPGNKGTPDEAYKSSGLAGAKAGSRYMETLASSVGTKRNTIVGDLKPKDLVGIPWRVAFALQQPYYTGRIKDERDRIWLAAMVEAEGCMFIHRRKAGTPAYSRFTKKDGTEVEYQRTQDTFGVGLEVSSTDRVIVERCREIAGIGSVCEQTPRQNERRKQTIYRWNARTNECRDVIRELYPHMIAKQHEARLVLGCPSSGEDARKAWESLKAIHQGEKPCIDFAPPEGMWERGWFLRSEIIWAKCMPNPMPESVTDRPTKSHEQVFLLTKSARYFFDQEAVREAYQPSTIDRDAYGYNHAFANQFKGSPTDERHPEGKQLPPGSFAKGPDGRRVTAVKGADGSLQHRDGERWPNPTGRNVRSVWEIATQPYPEAHFATYPEELVRRCIQAGCPEGGTVLDPFMGSGTTALVARKHGRRSIGIELSVQYAELAARRLQQQSLFAEGVS